MKYTTLFLITLFSFLLLNCGGSPMEEGDKAYNQGEYNLALKNYFEYKKENPQDNSINAKIALAYLHRGHDLFSRTRNISTFESNYEKAQKYMEDGFTDPAMQKEYSNMLYEFGMAYRMARPENEIQEDQYFDNTLEYLNLAIETDPGNMKADSTLAAIYDENYQKMFDRGTKYLEAAKKSKNNDYYLSAENFLSKAVQFNPASEEARKKLSDARKETLKILKYYNPVSFCVPGYKKSKKDLFVAITAQNVTEDPFELKTGNFELTCKDGTVYKVDTEKTAKLEKALTDNNKINPNKLLDVDVVFTIDNSKELESLAYVFEDGRSFKKYFP